MKTYVLYHSRCYDGFGAAWAAWNVFGDDATYLSVSYSKKEVPDIEPNSQVYIVDFSYPKEILLELSKTRRVVVLDHHKTAEADLRGLPSIDTPQWDKDGNGVAVLFNMDKSGALITWEYFHGKDSIPWLIKYISDRDLWKFEYEETKIIHEYLKSVSFNFENWTDISRSLDDQTGTGFLKILAAGEAVLNANSKTTKSICERTRVVNFEGYKVGVVNATSNWSEVGNYVMENFDVDFAISYGDIETGDTLYSLRSNERTDVDVSTIAKKYGGGGHKYAAGFKTKRLDILP